MTITLEQAYLSVLKQAKRNEQLLEAAGGNAALLTDTYKLNELMAHLAPNGLTVAIINLDEVITE